jgi:hypothetical protein
LRDKAVEQLKLVLRPMLPPRFELVVIMDDDTIYFKDQGVLPGIPQTALSALGLVEQPLKLAT